MSNLSKNQWIKRLQEVFHGTGYTLDLDTLKKKKVITCYTYVSYKDNITKQIREKEARHLLRYGPGISKSQTKLVWIYIALLRDKKTGKKFIYKYGKTGKEKVESRFEGGKDYELVKILRARLVCEGTADVFERNMGKLIKQRGLKIQPSGRFGFSGDSECFSDIDPIWREVHAIYSSDGLDNFLGK